MMTIRSELEQALSPALAVAAAADTERERLLGNAEQLASELAASQAARLTAEKQVTTAEATIAALRAELAAMNTGQRPQVLVPGFTHEVFYDPFTTLVEDHWNVYVGTLGSPREEYCRRENLRIVPQGLAGDTKREAFGGRSWTSWYLRSDGKVEYGLGHLFEVECTLPPLDKNASGLWAAPLWLRSTKKPGELDGGEAYGFPNLISDNTTDPKKVIEAAQMLNSIAATTHNDTNASGSAAKKTVIAPPGGTIPAGRRFRLGILPDQSGVTYFLDGKPMADINGRPNPASWEWLATKGIFKTNFDGPLHMRMQMQVGSSYWGPSRASTVPLATTLIHWARITRKP